MTNTCMQSLRRMSLWISLPCLLILVLAMAACGESTPTTTAPTPTTSSPQMQATPTTGSTTGTTTTGNTTATTTTITIAEQKVGGRDVYSFEPKTLTIKAGNSVKWVNKSDENHLLACTPADVVTAKSIVPKSGSPDNTYQITFPKAGTYSCTSKLVQRTNGEPENAKSDTLVAITVTP